MEATMNVLERVAIRLFIALIFASCAAGAICPSEAWSRGKADAAEVSEDDDVPKSPSGLNPSLSISKEYDTYSLFLIPEAWNAAKPSELAALRQEFKKFGEEIGHDHLAVWFLKDRAGNSLDFVRMRRYIRLVNRPLEEGPYVITTKQHPDHMKAGDETLIIQLKGVSAERARSILSVLERDLAKYNAAHPSFSEQALELERLEQILLTSVEENVSELKDVFVSLLSWK